jgi:hypothetical protein
MALHVPFSQYPRNLVAFCKGGPFPEPPRFVDRTSREGIEFIKSVLVPLPMLRPSADEAMKSKWFHPEDNTRRSSLDQTKGQLDVEKDHRRSTSTKLPDLSPGWRTGSTVTKADIESTSTPPKASEDQASTALHQVGSNPASKLTKSTEEGPFASETEFSRLNFGTWISQDSTSTISPATLLKDGYTDSDKSTKKTPKAENHEFDESCSILTEAFKVADKKAIENSIPSKPMAIPYHPRPCIIKFLRMDSDGRPPVIIAFVNLEGFSEKYGRERFKIKGGVRFGRIQGSA